MSCTSLKHVFDQEKHNGLSFKRALETYNQAKGSLAAHKAELAELQRQNADPERISHLQAHIVDGEKLLQEIESLRWR